MKRLLVLIIYALAPFLAFAQGTVSELESDFGGRVSVEIDKKLATGLHMTLGGQARLYDGFTDFGRYQADLGVTYKFNQWLRVGAGYIFIENKDSEGLWSPRHRFYADVTSRVKTGSWVFSLRERFQLTRRDGVNVYQTAPNAMALRSRLKAEYGGLGSVSPYAFFEARLTLNDPACSASWNGSEYSDYIFLGYTDTYFSRYRGCLGAKLKLNSRNAFDLYVMGDYDYEKDVDTNKKGTKLKSLTYDRSFNINVGVGYTFSF